MVIWDETEDFEFHPRKCITRTVGFQYFNFIYNEISTEVAQLVCTALWDTDIELDDYCCDMENFFDPVVEEYLKEVYNLYIDSYCKLDYEVVPVVH